VTRRLLTFALLAALALPAASAARDRSSGDGTLSVRDGRGIVVVSGRGGAIGSFARGSVTISDPIDGDGTGPIVMGDDFPPKERDADTTTWRGNKVRFRIIGGTFTIRVQGRGINLSFVGKATVKLNGMDDPDGDGVFAANGSAYTPIPALPVSFPLTAQSP
jgi:hypothetical protein